MLVLLESVGPSEYRSHLIIVLSDIEIGNMYQGYHYCSLSRFSLKRGSLTQKIVYSHYQKSHTLCIATEESLRGRNTLCVHSYALRLNNNCSEFYERVKL